MKAYKLLVKTLKSSVIGKLGIGLLFSIILSISSAPQLFATPILPLPFEVTEMMMSAEAAEADLIGFVIGVDPDSLLNFDSKIDLDNKFFSFETITPSTYLGESIQINSSGNFNSSNGLYEYTSEGSFGTDIVWTGSGFIDPDPSIDYTWTVRDPLLNTIIATINLKATGDFTVKIVDGETKSVTSKWDYTFTLDPAIGPKQVVSGKGTDKYDGKKWSFTTAMLNPDNNATMFATSSNGESELGGGVGSFNVSIVPEPATISLFFLGILCLTGVSRRKR